MLLPKSTFKVDWSKTGKKKVFEDRIFNQIPPRSVEAVPARCGAGLECSGDQGKVLSEALGRFFSLHPKKEKWLNFQDTDEVLKVLEEARPISERNPAASF